MRTSEQLGVPLFNKFRGLEREETCLESPAEQVIVGKAFVHEGGEVTKGKTGECSASTSKGKENDKVKGQNEITHNDLGKQMIIYDEQGEKGRTNQGKRRRRADRERQHKVQAAHPHATIINVQAVKMHLCEDMSHFFIGANSDAVFPFTTSKLFGVSMFHEHANLGCMCFCKRNPQLSTFKHLKGSLFPYVASVMNYKTIW